MKKQLLLTRMLLLVALLVGSVSVWADDILKETLDFTDASVKAAGYTSTSQWNSTWTLYGGNNNNKGWAYVRFGGKASTSGTATNGTATIYTTAKIENAIDYVVIEHLGVNGKKPADFSVTSIVLETSSSSDFSNATTTSLTSYDVASSTTTKSITITPTNQVAKDSYYRIKINWSSTNTNNMGLDVQKVKLYQNAPAYTITAQSNNTEYGTVSLSGSVITANPADGYRVSTSTPYTVNPANSATVSQNGNAFTVTPSDNTTVTINFEAIPTHTLSTAVLPSESGSVELASSTVAEGATTTATASPAAGYKFTSWSITTGATLSSTSTNPTTVTMGTADATITANFEAVKTYAIKWSVNGVVKETDNVEENAAITFPSSIDGIPTGYELKGWSETEILTPQTSAPSYVTEATSTENKTYYAVIAKGSPSPASLNKMTTGDTFSANDKVVVVAVIDEDTSYGMYQETTSSSYVNKFEFDGEVSSIVADNKKWWTVSAGTETNTWKLGDSTNGYLYTSGSNNLYADKDNSSDWTLTDNEDGTFKLASGRYLSCRSDLTGNNQYLFRMAGSNPAGVYSLNIYKYIPAGTAYSNYCTTAPVPVEVSALGYATFASDKALDFTDKSIKAYKATVTGTTVDFTPVNVVPAGEGVLLYADGGASIDVPVTTADAGDFTDNKLVRGTGASLTYGDNAKYYILSKEGNNVGFYKANGNVVAKTKAYLDLTGTNAKSFVLPGGETDGIRSIENSELRIENSNYYNLAGQRVGKDYKGIVIVNGKKMLNK